MVQPEARAFPRRGRVGRSVSKNVSRAEVTTRSCTEAFRAGRIRTSNRGVVPDLVGCSPGPAAISTLPMIWRGGRARSSFDVVSTAILSLWGQLRMRSCRKMSVGRGWLHHSDLVPRGGVENVMPSARMPSQARREPVQCPRRFFPSRCGHKNSIWADAGRRIREARAFFV